MLRRYELAHNDVRRIVEAARQLNVIPLATPFSPADVEVIALLDLPAVKIASPDVVNRPLLRRAAQTGKPLIISTGAATMDEIGGTAHWLHNDRIPFALLHCVSSYPTPTDEANLCWIGELAASFGAPAGFSDHTTELMSGALSVAAGATIVEKHLTYDRAAQGPDTPPAPTRASSGSTCSSFARPSGCAGGRQARAGDRERRAHRQPPEPRPLSRSRIRRGHS
jgi:sialic acid synthase SpsE